MLSILQWTLIMYEVTINWRASLRAEPQLNVIMLL